MFNEVVIRHDDLTLEGHVSYELNSKAWVIFAHGSGSSRKSTRNNWVAQELNKKGHATFLFDLLTYEEDLTYENRFNIPLLADRLKWPRRGSWRFLTTRDSPLCISGQAPVRVPP